MAALDAMRLGLPPSEQSSGALGESSGDLHLEGVEDRGETRVRFAHLLV